MTCTAGTGSDNLDLRNSEQKASGKNRGGGCERCPQTSRRTKMLATAAKRAASRCGAVAPQSCTRVTNVNQELCPAAGDIFAAVSCGRAVGFGASTSTGLALVTRSIRVSSQANGAAFSHNMHMAVSSPEKIRARLLGFRRAFCVGQPKKAGWGNFRLRSGAGEKPSKPGKHGGTQPAARKHNSTSRSRATKSSDSNGGGDVSGGGDKGGRNGGGPKTLGELFSSPIFSQMIATGLFVAGIGMLFGANTDAREISFQEFKATLLEAGLVDRIEVSNKTQAKVYVHATLSSSPRANLRSVGEAQRDFSSVANPAKQKYYFNIGSLESFERKLEEAQEQLGMDQRDFVPVTYVNEVAWSAELARLAPTLLLLAGFVFLNRRIGGMPGMGGPGGGGPGGTIFNVGKATVSTLDSNAKKVMFKGATFFL